MKEITFIAFIIVLLVSLSFGQEVKSCKLIYISDIYAEYKVYGLIDENGDTLNAFSYCEVNYPRINELSRVEENETYYFLLLELPVGFKLQLHPSMDWIVYKINGRAISKGSSLLRKCYYILNIHCDLINELKWSDEK